MINFLHKVMWAIIAIVTAPLLLILIVILYFFDKEFRDQFNGIGEYYED